MVEKVICFIVFLQKLVGDISVKMSSFYPTNNYSDKYKKLARIIFSRITLRHDLPTPVYGRHGNFAVSRGFYFRIKQIKCDYDIKKH